MRINQYIVNIIELQVTWSLSISGHASEGDDRVSGGLEELGEVLGADSGGGGVHHGVEVQPGVAAIHEGRVHQELDALLGVIDKGKGRDAALGHPQRLQHHGLVAKPELLGAHRLGYVVQLDLPVMDRREQVEVLLLVLEEEVLTDGTLDPHEMGHHGLHREHLGVLHVTVLDAVGDKIGKKSLFAQVTSNLSFSLGRSSRNGWLTSGLLLLLDLLGRRFLELLSRGLGLGGHLGLAGARGSSKELRRQEDEPLIHLGRGEQ